MKSVNCSLAIHVFKVTKITKPEILKSVEHNRFLLNQCKQLFENIAYKGLYIMSGLKSIHYREL